MSTYDYYTIEVSDRITTDAGTFCVRVLADPHYDGNPREDSEPLGTWVSWDTRRCLLPVEGDLVWKIKDAYDRIGPSLAVRYLRVVHGAVVLPVYGDDRTSAGKLGEHVDDGARITGVIYITREQIKRQWTDLGFPAPSDAKIAEWLAAEVDQYATWANGEMTSYVIERCRCGHPDDCDDEAHWEDVGSCSGYFSEDDAMDGGKEAIPTEAVDVPEQRQASGPFALRLTVDGVLEHVGKLHPAPGEPQTEHVSAAIREVGSTAIFQRQLDLLYAAWDELQSDVYNRAAELARGSQS